MLTFPEIERALVVTAHPDDVDFGAGDALFFALAVIAGPAMFMAFGAVASQLMPTRARAAGLSAAVLGVCALLHAGAASSGAGGTSSSPFGCSVRY